MERSPARVFYMVFVAVRFVMLQIVDNVKRANSGDKYRLSSLTTLRSLEFIDNLCGVSLFRLVVSGGSIRLLTCAVP
jgi:hypothetical protein